MWKSLLLFFGIFVYLANNALSQPFGPPLYIANPETLECRYYFSGDQKHFNPRPENYTESIGYTTEFKDKDQACGLYRCVKTGGRILLTGKDDTNPKLCECLLGAFWNNETLFQTVRRAHTTPLKSGYYADNKSCHKTRCRRRPPHKSSQA